MESASSFEGEHLIEIEEGWSRIEIVVHGNADGEVVCCVDGEEVLAYIDSVKNAINSMAGGTADVFAVPFDGDKMQLLPMKECNGPDDARDLQKLLDCIVKRYPLLEVTFYLED